MTGADLVADRLQRLARARSQVEVAALLGKVHGNRLADAAGCARDERSLAGESEIHVSSM